MSDVAVWPTGRRITVRDLQAATDRGERWSMLTSYDALTAGVFEQAGVRALLVGDTSAEMVLGYADTLPVTMDELVSMVAAVVRGTRIALVVADLPFGSYQAGPEVALANAVRHVKEGGAQAVKLEGGRRVVPQVAVLVGAGVPVMGHLGLTPQSVNVLGGTRRVQGRGDAGDQLLADALALERAGAFAVVLQKVECHALRGLHAHPGQPAQRLDERVERGFGHAPPCLEGELHARRQRHAGGVEHHRHQRVVARQRDQLDEQTVAIEGREQIAGNRLREQAADGCSHRFLLRFARGAHRRQAWQGCGNASSPPFWSRKCYEIRRSC